MVEDESVVVLCVVCLASLVASNRGKCPKTQYQIGLLVALAFGLSTLWISTWYSNQPFFESDFSEYCVGVIEMEKDWVLPMTLRLNEVGWLLFFPQSLRRYLVS